MARELKPKSPDAGDEHEAPEPLSDASGGSFRGAIDAFGAIYATLARLAIGGLEDIADRRAQARTTRLRQQRVALAKPLANSLAKPRRLRDRARRGSPS